MTFQIAHNKDTEHIYTNYPGTGIGLASYKKSVSAAKGAYGGIRAKKRFDILPHYAVSG